MRYLNRTKHPRLTLAVGVGIILLIVSLMLYRRLSMSADKVLAAARASFPDFCRNGIILVTEISDANKNEIPAEMYVPGRLWGIRCREDIDYHTYAAIIDVTTCTVLQGYSSLGVYYMEYQADFNYGSKMSVCPSDEP